MQKHATAPANDASIAVTGNVPGANSGLYQAESSTPAVTAVPMHLSLATDAASIPLVDHFIERDGEVFAGSHLIIDLWDGIGFDCLETMEAAMRRCIEVCGATLLHIHLHHFGGESGVSGVAVLAESHISVHSWPERSYAAFDVFMCGEAEPQRAVAVLQEAFSAQRTEVRELRRGVVCDAGVLQR